MVSSLYGVVRLVDDFQIGTLVQIVDLKGHSRVLELEHNGKSSNDSTGDARRCGSRLG